MGAPVDLAEWAEARDTAILDVARRFGTNLPQEVALSVWARYQPPDREVVPSPALLLEVRQWWAEQISYVFDVVYETRRVTILP